MGANLQYNSYLPGYYSAANLSLDANRSTWPLNFDDKISESGNYCNGFLSSDYLLAYNKEVLKRTMLKHETIFKDQIQELHRLYRRQRELMGEIRSNELDKHYLRLEASHSNTGFFQTSSEHFPKTFQAPRCPLIDPADSRISVSGSQKIQPPLSSVQGKNVQTCTPNPAKFDACSKDFQLLESKNKKFGKKLLDLQLSAVEYIDSEDKDLLDGETVSEMAEVSSYSVKSSPQVVYTSDVKSFFGSKVLNSFFHAATESPASILEKQKQSADLEEAASLSASFMGPTSQSKLVCSEQARKTKSGFQYSLEDSIQNTQKRPDLGPSVHFILAETQRKEEWQSYHDRADNLSSFSEFLHKDLEQVRQPPMFHQGNQTSLIERTIYDLECSRGSSAPSNDTHDGSHGAFPVRIFKDHGSQTNMTDSESSIMSWRKVSDSGRNPVAVQALPCFNTSLPLDKRSKSSIGRPEHATDSKLVPDNHGLTEHKGSISIQSSNDINLNSRPRSFSSEFVVSRSIQATQGVEKRVYSVGEFAWLGKDKSGHGTSTQVESLSLEIEAKKVEENDSREMIPASHDSSSSYIFGHHSSSSSNPSKTCQNPCVVVKRKGEDRVLDLNSACDSVPESETELTADKHVVEHGVGRKHVGFGFLIDLNSSINEAESSQELSHTEEIDLDAPGSPENKERSPPRGESDENQVETPLLSGQEDDHLPDELTRIAAEAIVSISSSRSESSLQKITLEHLEASSHDSLHWFAGIVSSVLTDPLSEFGSFSTAKKNENCEELLPDGIDYFEAMTLTLTETKVEEYCCKSNGSKEEETGTSSSPSQLRKGRTRRGRQRKDFQTEILPSLASLSRYEVTEDLQTIGGLMEAAGTHWETGSMRYGARNGYSRGRKRSSVSGSNAAVGCSVESMLKKLNSNNKLGKEERSVVCWGKVTRRRRGQRCPVRVSNPHLILSQVQ
ncbi:hypothetical protein TorRG33x02_022330 [Trema orientale]|uniref:Uncharacterized protein n=1 Tax=Trema orientale TaxID=63057 RepID=A0A2P5FVW0_TREOI|nr:hypothetical protein TorRG33x02_022330 [Trema orientale]